MSDQTQPSLESDPSERNVPVPSEYFGTFDTCVQSEPSGTPLLREGDASLLVPPPINTPRFFPLTRQTSVSQQIFGMLLYSLLLMLSIMGCLLYLSKNDPSGSLSFSSLSLLIDFILAVVLAPASTLLCALFFGSWRGIIVSFISIYGGIQLTHLLNNQFWSDTTLGSFSFLIPLLFVTFIVGLIYEFRKDASWWKGVLTMLVGAPIVVFTFFMLIPDQFPGGMSPLADLLFCGELLLLPVLILVWVVFLVGIETILPRLIGFRKQRQ